jgi:hypothetical protein
MSKTQHNGNERKVDRVEAIQDNLIGLQEMGPAELAAVEGGLHGTSPEMPTFDWCLCGPNTLPKKQ